MITVNIKGGLGNQMFQYACARALAIRNNDDLRLVRIEKSSDITRPFSLAHFNIAGDIGKTADIGLWQNLRVLFEQKILRRFYVEFVPSILGRKGNIYLDGYFQSEKYFINQAAAIRQDFTLKDNLSADARAAADVIKADDKSVSLHVRRGDYVTHPDFGDIANREYYARAIMKMRREIAFARFYIFSDDIAWCKDNLPLPEEGTVFISKPGMKDYEELTLMSLCKHNIIANSSFSWWGAWLNPNPVKTVIAPTRWANQHEDWYKDVIPETWIRL